MPLPRQVDGHDLDLTTAGPLRDDISTDEITPVPILTHYDERLGRYPYTGFKVEGRTPIGVGAVLRCGFCVTVAGSRYGKGSSREHSPAAEKLAGIRLVIAESFERIYRQNADNIGLFTSTDFSLVERIQRGAPIALDELLAGRDALAASILRSGGLLRFGQQHMRSIVQVADAPTGPQNLFEKIVARHALRTEVTDASVAPGQGTFVRADWRFIHEYYTGMCAHMLHSTFGKPLVLHEPQSVVVFEDHTSYVSTSPTHVKNGLVPNVLAMVRAQRDFAASYQLRMHRTLTEDEAALDDGSNTAGISHAMMAEHYALPGQLVAGTDSHTPHSGALGCVAFGVGTTDMANALVTGAVRLTVPESLRIDLQGPVADGITAKDIVLHLLALPAIRGGLGVGKVFEFTGSATTSLSIDERTTLTNMTAELGGLTGIVAPDDETVRFLRERRGIDFAIEPWMRSDEGATYADTIRIDCSRLSPMVASPGDPGHGLELSQLKDSGQDRHRLRRLLHRRQARGFRLLPRRAVVGTGTRSGDTRRRKAVPAIRNYRGTRLLRRKGLRPNFRRGGRPDPSALVRSVRELRARLVDECGSGDGKRDQPEFSGSFRPRSGMARKSADRGRQCARGGTRVVRRVEAADPQAACNGLTHWPGKPNENFGWRLARKPGTQCHDARCSAICIRPNSPDRFPGHRQPDDIFRATGRVPSKPARAGLDRRPDRDDRVSLGGRGPQSAPDPGHRARSAQG